MQIFLVTILLTLLSSYHATSAVLCQFQQPSVLALSALPLELEIVVHVEDDVLGSTIHSLVTNDSKRRNSSLLSHGNLLAILILNYVCAHLRSPQVCKVCAENAYVYVRFKTASKLQPTQME